MHKKNKHILQFEYLLNVEDIHKKTAYKCCKYILYFSTLYFQLYKFTPQ